MLDICYWADRNKYRCLLFTFEIKCQISRQSLARNDKLLWCVQLYGKIEIYKYNSFCVICCIAETNQRSMSRWNSIFSFRKTSEPLLTQSDRQRDLFVHLLTVQLDVPHFRRCKKTLLHEKLLDMHLWI